MISPSVEEPAPLGLHDLPRRGSSPPAPGATPTSQTALFADVAHIVHHLAEPGRPVHVITVGMGRCYPAWVHETQLRVRFDEVDSMGVVHHPRYIVYFEIARTAFMRDLGASYAELMASGAHLAVVDVEARYLRTLRYDEEIVVQTRCSAVRGARVEFTYRVIRGEELVASGRTMLGCITPEGRPRRLPPEVRALFDAATSHGDANGVE